MKTKQKKKNDNSGVRKKIKKQSAHITIQL